MEIVWSMLSMLGMLALMIAIFAGAYFVTRMVGSRYVQPGAPGKKIRVLDQAMTGKEERLLLVKVAEKVYLLSSGPAGTQKLDELDSALFPEEKAPEQSAADASFLHVLSEAVRRQHGGTAGGNAP